MVTTGLGGLGHHSDLRNQLAGWLQARLGFPEPYPPNGVSAALGKHSATLQWKKPEEREAASLWRPTA